MCLLQVGLGLVAHYVKFTLVKHSSGRGISHFAHLLLGLVTIVIGYATVWTGESTREASEADLIGMDDEYPAWSGYGPVSSGWKAGYGVVVGVSRCFVSHVTSAKMTLTGLCAAVHPGSGVRLA